MVQTVFLGKYELVRPLGAGSMGRVYLCKERTTGQEVVVNAELVEKAVSQVLAEGLRTADLMQPGKTKVGTKEMGAAILKALARLGG